MLNVFVVVEFIIITKVVSLALAFALIFRCNVSFVVVVHVEVCVCFVVLISLLLCLIVCCLIIYSYFSNFCRFNSIMLRFVDSFVSRQAWRDETWFQRRLPGYAVGSFALCNTHTHTHENRKEIATNYL